MADNNSLNSRNSNSPIQDPAQSPVHQRRSNSDEKGDGEVVVSKQVSLEKDTTISDRNLETKLKSGEDDVEAGGPTTKRARYWGLVQRHWKRTLFIVVWLLFTG